MKTIKKLANGVLAVEAILALINRYTLEGAPKKIQFLTYGRSLEELRDLGLLLSGKRFAIQGQLCPEIDIRPLLKTWIFNEDFEFSLRCLVGRDSITIAKSRNFLLLSQNDIERRGALDKRYLAPACQMLRDLGIPKILRGEHALTPSVQVKWEEGFSDSVSFRGGFEDIPNLLQAVIDSLPDNLPLAGQITAPLEIISDLSTSTFHPREDDRWFLGYSGDNLAPSDVPPERVVELIRHVEAHPGGEDALFFNGLTWKNMTKTGPEPSTDFLWTRERGKPAVIRVTSIDPLPKTWITALTVEAEQIVAGQEQRRHSRNSTTDCSPPGLSWSSSPSSRRKGGPRRSNSGASIASDTP